MKPSKHLNNCHLYQHVFHGKKQEGSRMEKVLEVLKWIVLKKNSGALAKISDFYWLIRKSYFLVKSLNYCQNYF